MAEIIAKLGLDSSRFDRGLTQANVSFGRFREALKIGRIGGAFSTVLGAGGIIQGFRATINAAQEARDRAAELGRTVDEGTASVARYGDAWDRIKRTVAETAISGLGLVVRSGEAIGELLNDQVASRFRGMTPEQAKRTREVSEGAAANADRLSSPQAMAAARARGEARVAADAQNMREVSRLMNDGAERREESALREKPLAEQITVLEQKRNALLREYNDGRRTVLARAKAFAEAAKTEEKIAERRRDLEKQTTDEQERQARQRQTQLEQERRALENMRAAEEQMQLARARAEQNRVAQQQAKTETLLDLGSSLTTGRAIAPRSRGRSERERIADRGESFRMQAEDAIRTGKSPEYVARLTKLATRDTLAAGKAAERTMKQIDKTDPAVGQLIRIHKSLEEINKNLAPTDTK